MTILYDAESLVYQIRRLKVLIVDYGRNDPLIFGKATYAFINTKSTSPGLRISTTTSISSTTLVHFADYRLDLRSGLAPLTHALRGNPDEALVSMAGY